MIPLSLWDSGVTLRELDILAAIGRGVFFTEQIAARLRLSHNAVCTTCTRLRRKGLVKGRGRGEGLDLTIDGKLLFRQVHLWFTGKQE